MQELKARANRLFEADRFADAVALYTTILDDAAAANDVALRATVFANRAACFLKLDEPSKALADCANCLVRHQNCSLLLSLLRASNFIFQRLQKTHEKAWYRRVLACRQLGRVGAAWRAVDRCCAPAPLSSAFVEITEQVRRDFVARWYSSATRVGGNGPFASVRVDHVSARRGKALVASKRVADARLLLFTETPLISVAHSFDERVEFCSHCLQSRLTTATLGGAHTAPLIDVLYGGNGSDAVLARATNAFVWQRCQQRCNERYCSVQCRDAAAHAYHAALCEGACVDDEARRERRDALAQLASLSRTSQRNNLLLIARMLAREALARKRQRKLNDDNDDNEDDNFDDSDDNNICIERQQHDNFAWYLAGDERSDAEFVRLMSVLLGDRHTTALLRRARRFDGAIRRNASELAPVSDLHLLLASSTSAVRAALLWQLDGIVRSDVDVADLTTIVSLQRLCVRGTGLFATLNCANHSCEPNGEID